MAIANLIGASAKFRAVLDNINVVAPVDAAVLIQGESGTGKELIARAVHNQSPRSTEMFQAVNCAAINENLLESELFGHEKGSFTGAHAEKKGLFEIADRGTLFLDEIAELDVGIQAKLLRALQERKIRRVGGTHEISVDVRVIAATNKDLLKEVDAKNFRLDLYHRLSVILIHVPSLNERRDDIPLLVDQFLKDISIDYGNAQKQIEPDAVQLLEEYNWTGNIRELRNVVERLVILSGKNITIEDVRNYVMPK